MPSRRPASAPLPRNDGTEAAAAGGGTGATAPHPAAATFLIFFQAFMVAPLIPRLASVLGCPRGRWALSFPPTSSLTVSRRCSSACCLTDSVDGRRRLILGSLVAFVLLTAATASTGTSRDLILWRFATGVGASGVVPVSLALLGKLFPYERRGRALGWLFGAMAGGMAFGSTFSSRSLAGERCLSCFAHWL